MTDAWPASSQITVYESLVYSASLRFDRDVEQAIVLAFVQEARPSPRQTIALLLSPGQWTL